MDFLLKLGKLTFSRIALANRGKADFTGLCDYADFDEWEKAWEKLLLSDNDSAKRFKQLLFLCGNGAFACAILCLTLTSLLHREFAEYIAAEGGVTLENAQRQWLIEGDDADKKMLLSVLRGEYNAVSRLLLCERSEEPFFHHKFKADERIISYICGETTIDVRIAELEAEFFTAAAPLPPIYVREAEADKIADAIKNCSPDNFLQLAGEEGIGKRFLLRHALARLSSGAIFISAEKVFLHKNAEALVKLIRRELILHSVGICFYGVDDILCPNAEKIRLFNKICLEPLSGFVRCVLCSGMVEFTAHLPYPVLRISLEPFSRGEQLALWKGYSEQYSLVLPDFNYISGSFKLNGAQIQKAVQRLAALNKGQPLDKAAISEACMAVLPPPQSGGIIKQKTTYTLEDLKLPEEQRQRLVDICAHVEHRYLVYDQWDMGKKYSYGQNVSALFIGAPGTGKTMAVHVLSDMLGIPLYRIDLSQVVDKYIGETEKRLEEIFSIAQKSNTILFFDEADAIFGKRSEVNDSKDRYANTEVSYILQRIEEYEGVVILATNYKKNIDEAFMRRIRYIVEFLMPNEELRYELWRSCFTKEVPTSGIDFEFLAHQFELAGGAIKNIVLNAVFMAAGRNSPVNMPLICECIRQENIKVGKAMIKQDFAEYGDLLSWN